MLPEENRQHPRGRLRDVSRVTMPPPSGRADLRLAPPTADDPEYWRRLMNHLFLAEEDELFAWLRNVRAVVEASA